MTERLQKFLSAAGVASRRHAEEMMAQGLVKVNGKVVKEMGTKINPDKDRVQVSGKEVKVQNKIYLAFNKPARYMTTRNDPERRKTIFDLLPPDLRTKVWPIGRLDFNTEGLLLLTNDGDLTQTLSHPSKEHDKEYEVILDKEITPGKLEKIRTGIRLGDKVTTEAKAWGEGKKVRLVIHEGWNRQIRRMFSAIGYTVRNLRRVRIGRLKLGNIPLGKYQSFTPEEVLDPKK